MKSVLELEGISWINWTEHSHVKAFWIFPLLLHCFLGFVDRCNLNFLNFRIN